VLAARGGATSYRKVDFRMTTRNINPTDPACQEKNALTTNDMMREVQDQIRTERELYVGDYDGPPEFTPGELEKAARSEHDGDAALFVRLNRGHFVKDKASGDWYRWTGQFWQLDRIDDVMTALDAVIELYANQADKAYWLRRSATVDDKSNDAKEAEAKEKLFLNKIKYLQREHWKQSVLNIASAGRRSLAITGDEWDNDPWLLGCRNGTIDLKTGDFRAGRQDDYIRTVCPTDWHGIEAKAPRFKQFLKDIFSDDQELIDYVQRLLGYAIVGDPVEDIFPILWGRGRNGKGTLIDVLRSVLGDVSVIVKSEMLLRQTMTRSSGSPDPDIMQLRGRRLAFCSETEDGRRLNAGKVKWLCGGDVLAGRDPYGKRIVNFRPTHQLFLLTNFKPRANADDYALWKRLHLIPFQVSFVNDPKLPDERKADPRITDKLTQEAPGILAWLVRGCLEWQRIGLNPPAVVQDATREYQDESDFIGQFLRDRCEMEPRNEETAGELYKAYCQWCENDNSKPVTRHKFSDALQYRFDRDNTGRHTIYKGLRLKTEIELGIQDKE